jgi:hypothetical protein
LPDGGGLTAPHTRSNRPLWTADFRVVSAVMGACVLRCLVVFVPRTSSTPVATGFWQTEGRSVECVILGVRPSEFILLEFQSPSRKIFYRLPFTPPPLSGRLIGPSVWREPFTQEVIHKLERERREISGGRSTTSKEAPTSGEEGRHRR